VHAGPKPFVIATRSAQQVRPLLRPHPSTAKEGHRSSRSRLRTRAAHHRTFQGRFACTSDTGQARDDTAGVRPVGLPKVYWLSLGFSQQTLSIWSGGAPHELTDQAAGPCPHHSMLGLAALPPCSSRVRLLAAGITSQREHSRSRYLACGKRGQWFRSSGRGPADQTRSGSCPHAWQPMCFVSLGGKRQRWPAPSRCSPLRQTKSRIRR
jgi:hypothetical protein